MNPEAGFLPDYTAAGQEGVVPAATEAAMAGGVVSGLSDITSGMGGALGSGAYGVAGMFVPEELRERAPVATRAPAPSIPAQTGALPEGAGVLRPEFQGITGQPAQAPNAPSAIGPQPVPVTPPVTPAGQPSTGPADEMAAAQKFMQAVIASMGVDPIKMNPFKDAVSAATKEYDDAYGTNPDGTAKPGGFTRKEWMALTKEGYQNRVAMLRQEYGGVKEDAMKTLAMQMQMFKDHYAKTMAPGQTVVSAGKPYTAPTTLKPNESLAGSQGQVAVGVLQTEQGKNIVAVPSKFIPGTTSFAGPAVRPTETDVKGAKARIYGPYTAKTTREANKIIAEGDKDDPRYAASQQYLKALDSNYMEQAHELIPGIIGMDRKGKLNNVGKYLLGSIENIGRPQQPKGVQNVIPTSIPQQDQAPANLPVVTKAQAPKNTKRMRDTETGKIYYVDVAGNKVAIER